MLSFTLVVILCVYVALVYLDFRRKPTTISVCIPCIPRDIGKLPRVLRSINHQSRLPLEVIIGLSETTAAEAKILEKKLNRYNYPLKIVSTVQQSYAGPNRNRAAKHTKGALISFMDADDIMHNQKLEIIGKIYTRYRPKCIVHGLDGMSLEERIEARRKKTIVTRNLNKTKIKKFNTSHDILKILQGKEIFDIASNQQENFETNDWYSGNILHNHIRLDKNGIRLGDFCHGHPTIQRSVMNHVIYGRKPAGEDAVFIRNLLKFYKRKDDTIIWVDSALSYYIPSKYQTQTR